MTRSRGNFYTFCEGYFDADVVSVKPDEVFVIAPRREESGYVVTLNSALHDHDEWLYQAVSEVFDDFAYCKGLTWADVVVIFACELEATDHVNVRAMQKADEVYSMKVADLKSEVARDIRERMYDGMPALLEVMGRKCGEPQSARN